MWYLAIIKIIFISISLRMHLYKNNKIKFIFELDQYKTVWRTTTI